ncbi:alpha-lytic protease prodomain-containing protein [Streptomyces sp. NBC_00201]|uniref:alpha-lytic protease prodomain-containing protein n=1 Tax=unclassified Streptomyces TaxID=2593676 RepID=UPI00225920F0|nr:MULTISPECIES: alpha-lytic protease prodomain-containing protein [unclassified Streptomyces]MCX5058882.1 alpha-lytic protease prodomain-containing protein [Streptomyces sp. NBC_00452]MCX5244237.1 alpha-lytic protease prodomain-containing protein [Streptomyces sp. NBC_00201]
MVGRHAAGTRRAALTALGALVLTGLPAAAEAAPPPAPGPARTTTAAHTLGADRPSAQVLRAMVRDLRLTRSQAVARLVNEAEAGARAGRLHNALGGHFAGAWVSGATSAELTVATTDAADVTAIRAQGAKATVVKTPLSTLQTVKEKLDAAARRVRSRDTPVWYVDVPTNRVVVEARSRSAATAFVKAAGVEGRGVAVRVTAVRPRLMTDIVGGDAYYIDATARCSVGFSVSKGQQQGFASAGHCGTPGAKTTGYDKADQGTFQASTFPGKDMSWVGVNSNWTATPDIKGQGGQRTQIAGSVQALVGASVCRSGSTTGWHCGTIQQLSATVDYAEGTVSGLTRTNVCTEPGDSGGPFVSGAQAQGVTSGGSGDCTRGGTTFFQPVNPILSDFGLTLKTAAGQAGAPAPQDNAAADAWFAGRVYEVGTTVTHAGVRYQCLQSHQAQGTWSPEDTPALWQRM